MTLRRRPRPPIFPIQPPPHPAGVLCEAISQKLAQFAHDHRKDYDIAAFHAAIEIMYDVQEYLEATSR